MAAVGIPQYKKYMLNAKTTEAVTAMKQIADAMRAYYDTHGQYPSNMLRGGVYEDWVVDPRTTASYNEQHGISIALPTLDISSSTNWLYEVVADVSGNFCINATAISVNSYVNGNAIWYVNDLSGLDASQWEGNFYKQGLFASPVGSINQPPLSGLSKAIWSCPGPTWYLLYDPDVP